MANLDTLMIVGQRLKESLEAEGGGSENIEAVLNVRYLATDLAKVLLGKALAIPVEVGKKHPIGNRHEFFVAYVGKDAIAVADGLDTPDPYTVEQWYRIGDKVQHRKRKGTIIAIESQFEGDQDIILEVGFGDDGPEKISFRKSRHELTLDQGS